MADGEAANVGDALRALGLRDMADDEEQAGFSSGCASSCA